MKIVGITVSSGVTLSHPVQSYSNLRVNIVLNAELSDTDDLKAVAEELQLRADVLCAQHMNKKREHAIATANALGNRSNTIERSGQDEDFMP